MALTVIMERLRMPTSNPSDRLGGGENCPLSPRFTASLNLDAHLAAGSFRTLGIAAGGIASSACGVQLVLAGMGQFTRHDVPHQRLTAPPP
jgi:hypothetical protein